MNRNLAISILIAAVCTIEILNSFKFYKEYYQFTFLYKVGDMATFYHSACEDIKNKLTGHDTLLYVSENGVIEPYTYEFMKFAIAPNILLPYTEYETYPIQNKKLIALYMISGNINNSNNQKVDLKPFKTLFKHTNGIHILANIK